MPTPEHVPMRCRRQVLDDRDRLDAEAMEVLEREDRWVEDFVTKLNSLLGRIRHGKPGRHA
jgi:hypothetical protein